MAKKRHTMEPDGYAEMLGRMFRAYFAQIERGDPDDLRACRNLIRRVSRQLKLTAIGFHIEGNPSGQTWSLERIADGLGTSKVAVYKWEQQLKTNTPTT